MRLLDLLKTCININVTIYDENAHEITHGNAGILFCTEKEKLKDYEIVAIFNGFTNSSVLDIEVTK